MNSIYRTLLKQSFHITWNNKWLWILGLFAMVLGNGGAFNILINNVRSIEDQGTLITQLNTAISQGGVGSLFKSFTEVFVNLNAQSIAALIIILIIGLFLLWLAIMCQGGLISGIFRTYKKQIGEAGWENAKESLKRGLSKFWPVFWVNIGGKVLVFVALIVLSLPFFILFVTSQNLIWQWVMLVISFMVLVPAAIIIAFLITYATIYVVIKNSDLKLAIQQSWKLFINNWLVSLEMAIILFVVNFAAGIILLVTLAILLIPFFILGFIANYFILSSLLWFAIILGGLVTFVYVFAFGAALTTFQTSVWVLLFNRITESQIIPKTIRIATALPYKMKNAKRPTESE